MASQEVEILLRAKGQFDQAFKALMGSMKETREEGKRMKASLEDSLGNFGSKATAAGAALAPLSLAITGVGVASLKMAMNAVESENLVSVAFKDMEGAARTWSQGVSAAVGSNEFELRKNAATLFTMTSAMGLTKDAAFQMSTGMVELAADMASFYNISSEDAFAKLRSGIVGEAEPLKQLGILIDEATIKTTAYQAGIAKFGAELTAQQKVAARWLAIQNQTKDAHGDLARTITSPTNQMRILGEQVKQLSTQFGMALLPIFTQVLDLLRQAMPVLQGVVQWFSQLSPSIQTAIVAIAGLVAALGPALVSVGMIASLWAAAIPAITAAGPALAAVAVAMTTVAMKAAAMAAGAAAAAAPFLPLAAAIAAAAVAGYKIGDWMRGMIDEYFPNFSKGLDQTIQGWYDWAFAVDHAKLQAGTKLPQSTVDFARQFGENQRLPLPTHTPGIVPPPMTDEARKALEKYRQEVAQLSATYRESNTQVGIFAERSKQVTAILQGMGAPTRASGADVQRAVTALAEQGDKGRKAANNIKSQWERANGTMLITSSSANLAGRDLGQLATAWEQTNLRVHDGRITQEQWDAAGRRARETLLAQTDSATGFVQEGKYVREVMEEINTQTGETTVTYGQLLERTKDGSGWKVIDEGARRSMTAVDGLKFALSNATGILEIMGLQGDKTLSGIASLAQAAASGDIMGGLAAGAEMSQRGGILGTYASMFTGGGVLSTIGGLFGGGPEKQGKQSIDQLMGAIADGAKPTADQIANLGDEFARLRGEAAEAGRVGDKAMLDMMTRARELGVELPGMAEHIREALGTAASGVGMMVASFEREDPNDEQSTKYKSGIAILTPEDARSQATLFNAVFWASVKENGLISAADSMREPMAHLKETLGFFGDELATGMMAPVQRVIDMTAEGSMFRGAAEGLQGVQQIVEGLANSGYLTADAFNAAGQQAMAAFEQMVSGGAGVPEAIMVAVPAIQSAISAAEQLGLPLDENWQRMREIAEENGVAFRTDPMRAAADAMLEVAGALREIIGQADGVAAAIGKIPRETNVRVNYQTSGSPGGPPPPGEPEEWNAKGDVVYTPSIRGVGEAGAEVIAPVSALFGRLGDDIAQRVAGAVGGGAGQVIQIFLGGQKIDEYIVRRNENGYLPLGQGA